MIKSFKTEFNFDDTVALKTEPSSVRVVTGFLIRKGSVTIGLANGTDETWHQLGEVMKVKGSFVVKGFKG